MTALAPEAGKAFDLERVRSQFPILERPVRGRRLVYLDSAATSQKPLSVIEAESAFYRTTNANIHRGVHLLSQEATEAYEAARGRVARFLNASPDEIVFTSGTTGGLNLVAQSYGSLVLRPGDEVLLTQLEHHSNIVPWQLACERAGASIRVVPVTDAGEVEIGAFEEALSDRTKIAAFPHVSNALGTVLPVAELAAAAKRRGATVVVDGAQGIAHGRPDVRALGCDFYAFGAHKVYGPTGAGALWGRRGLLEAMPPYQGGGDMIRTVTFEKTTYADPPARFEAGTPNIAGVVGMAAALDWVEQTGVGAILEHEAELLRTAREALSEVPGLRLIGNAERQAGVQSFVIEGVHPHDLATILDARGVAVRAGHHCAQPLMARLGLPATTRASFAAYSGRDDVEALVGALRFAAEVLGA